MEAFYEAVGLPQPTEEEIAERTEQQGLARDERETALPHLARTTREAHQAPKEQRQQPQKPQRQPQTEDGKVTGRTAQQTAAAPGQVEIQHLVRGVQELVQALADRPPTATGPGAGAPTGTPNLVQFSFQNSRRFEERDPRDRDEDVWKTRDHPARNQGRQGLSPGTRDPRPHQQQGRDRIYQRQWNRENHYSRRNQEWRDERAMDRQQGRTAGHPRDRDG
ncbi:hypothetical protein OTU49_013342, partial [Cherax quadricarinatus]